MKRSASMFLYDESLRILLQKRGPEMRTYPNCWGFFGGSIENGETPEQAVMREIFEELEYKVSHPTFVFDSVGSETDGSIVTRYLFVAPYDKKVPLVLREGAGMGWFDLNAARQIVPGELGDIVDKIGQFLTSKK